MNDWIDDVASWIGDVDGRDAADDARSAWAQMPEDGLVVSLFGAFDSAKTTLLRRLLAERGAPTFPHPDGPVRIPDWATVTARHETFEARRARVGSLYLQDTPGISQGTDDRSHANTRCALYALRLSDVVLVTTTPQLLTAERDLVTEALADWTEGCAFVVGRFDEAGFDPDDEPEEYAVLARRKEAELRASMALSAEVPVFVAAADPAGLHSTDRDLGPDTWADSRQWDGIDQVLSWLDRLSDHPSDIRAAAETRYWAGHIAPRIQELQAAADDVQALLEASEGAQRRKESMLKRLDAISSAAQARLDGVMEEAVRGAAQSALPGQPIHPHILEAPLNHWYDEQRHALETLGHEIREQGTAQRQRPIIKILLGEAEPEGNDPRRSDPGHTREVAKRVRDIVKSVRGAAPRKPASRAGQPRPTAKTPTPKTPHKPGFLSKSLKALAILEATVVPAAELVALFQEETQRKELDKQRTARITQLRAQIREQCQQAASELFGHWKAERDAVAELIEDELGSIADGAGPFRDQLIQLRGQVQVGEQLLADRPSQLSEIRKS